MTRSHGSAVGRMHLAKSASAIQIVGKSVRGMAALEAHAVAHGALRVHVDDERLQPSSSERCRKVDGGRRLSNATLLTDDSEHMPHGYGSVSSRAARGSVPLRKSSSVCCACRTQRSDSAPDGGCRQKCLEVLNRAVGVAFLEEKEREPIMRARQTWARDRGLFDSTAPLRRVDRFSRTRSPCSGGRDGRPACRGARADTTSGRRRNRPVVRA